MNNKIFILLLLIDDGRHWRKSSLCPWLAEVRFMFTVRRKFSSYYEKGAPHRQLINYWMKKSKTQGLVYNKPGSGRCQQSRDYGWNWIGVGKESQKHALHICWIQYSRNHRLQNSNRELPKHAYMFKCYQITMLS